MLVTFLQYLLLSLAFAAPFALGLVLAVDPGSRRPGVGVKIDLRTGTSSIAGGAIRYLLLSTKNDADGAGEIETLYEDLVNADAVRALTGAGGMADLCAQRIFEEHPQAPLDLLIMDISGATATGTITFDDGDPITAAQTVTAKIAGRTVTIVWLVGEDDVAAASKLVAKISLLTRTLPIVASNSGGSSAVVTLTFKQDGEAGNDCLYSVSMTGGAGGDVEAAADALTGGSGEPDATNCLALVVQREYRLIVPCLSNDDLSTATTSSNMGLIRTHITGHNTGIGALLQTAHTACTDNTSNAKAMTGQHDFEYFSHHLARGAGSLPCEWGGAISGLYGATISQNGGKNAAPNMIKREFVATLYGGTEADALLPEEEEDLLQSGVSYIGYTLDRARRPRLGRPITTYFEDSDGNPDDRVLDVSKPFGMIAVAADLRVFAERRFAGAKLVKTLPAGRTGIPADVVSESTAKAALVARIRSEWCPAGVVDEVLLDGALADGSLVVAVDETDGTQLDTFFPLGIVKPLAKLSLVFVQV